MTGSQALPFSPGSEGVVRTRWTTYGLVAAGVALAAVWVVPAPVVLGVDEVIYRWSMFMWSERTARAVDWIGLAVPLALGALVVLALVGGLWRQPGRFVVLTGVVGSGALVTIESGTAAGRAALIRWTDGWVEPVGAVAWGRHSGAALRIHTPSDGDASELKVVLGPHTCEAHDADAGVRVVLSVNGATLRDVVVRRRWREYNFVLPRGNWRRGENLVTFSVHAGPRPCETAADALVGLRSLRLFRGSRADALLAPVS